MGPPINTLASPSVPTSVTKSEPKHAKQKGKAQTLHTNPFSPSSSFPSSSSASNFPEIFPRIFPVAHSDSCSPSPPRSRSPPPAFFSTSSSSLLRLCSSSSNRPDFASDRGEREKNLFAASELDMCVEGFEDAERLGFAEAEIERPADFAMERVCENAVSLDFKQTKMSSFTPAIRSGDWSDIGGRDYMEDAHVCISNLAKNFGCNSVEDEIISFYGVFDGHGGKDAAQYVRDNLPRIIVEDAAFPLELEKVVRRSFAQTDSQFAEKCSRHNALSSGTTALTAMIFGRSLLVANAGDCRAVLSRRGTAVEMSKDHRTCCLSERKRVESLGGYVDDGYLNGQLAVTRALGDWHIEGLKEMGEPGGPLSAEPELKMITLTKDDEFLIIGSDGIWDFFSNQNSVDFARRRLQEHNDLRLCCKEIVEEAIRRGATDNLTAVMVSFHQEAPPQIRVKRTGRVERSISAEGLHNIRVLLEGQ